MKVTRSNAEYIVLNGGGLTGIHMQDTELQALKKSNISALVYPVLLSKCLIAQHSKWINHRNCELNFGGTSLK